MKLLGEYPKVRYNFSGHSHADGQWQNGDIVCYNISRENRPLLVTLEI